MTPRSPGPLSLIRAAAIALLAVSAGDLRGPETGYGSSRGASLNGTGAFAGLIHRQGHEVRTALRLSDDLAQWADVIVRFASIPGPPDKVEASWYTQWLDDRPERALVYVVRDYDAQAEYWNLVLNRPSGELDTERRKRAEWNRDETRNWVADLPSKAAKPADAAAWFAVGPAVNPPSMCKTLGGSWGVGIDAIGAALTLHEPLMPRGKHVLLRGDDKVLAMEWSVGDGSRVLAVANGSFLLNLPLVNPARRPLAVRVVQWIGNEPRRVAFVDGPSVVGGPQAPPSFWDLIGGIPSFRWVAFHLGVVGLFACLARAPQLGRPRPEPPSDASRPAAHAEALGALLARTRATNFAHELLRNYRRWRHHRKPSEDPLVKMQAERKISSWRFR
jgi:hypothetical protein